MKILVTNGGTKVKIDDVRFIGNSSKGRYGAEIANCFQRIDSNEVLCFTEIDSAKNLDACVGFITFDDYFSYLSVKRVIADFKPDIIVSAAAVSDFICDKIDGKISSGDEIVIKLRKAEKVISSFRELAPNAYIVGFKLLHDVTDSHAEDVIGRFIDRDSLDAVVFNDLKKLRGGKTERFLYEKHDNILASTKHSSAFDLCRVILKKALDKKRDLK